MVCKKNPSFIGQHCAIDEPKLLLKEPITCKLSIVHPHLKIGSTSTHLLLQKVLRSGRSMLIINMFVHTMKQIVIHLLDSPDGTPRLCKMQSLAPNQRRLSFAHLYLILQPYCEQHQVAYHCYRR